MTHLLAILALLLVAPWALAHEVRPAYLLLHQIGPDTYDVVWKVPGRGTDLRLGLYVELPDDCSRLSEPKSLFANNAFTECWTVRRAGGLSGSRIQIAGLEATMTDVLARVERLDGTTQMARLTPAAPSFVVEASPRKMQVAATYTRLGVEHILGGVDHLLYILALLFLLKGCKPIVLTMTAFTAAHSLTLTAASLGWVQVAQRPIEACIALSILLVAREIVCSRQEQAGITERCPWLVSFTFGLLHGFGFAGALSEVGLPPTAIPIALLFFNLGVEIGQILFITLALAFIAVAQKTSKRLGTLKLPPHLCLRLAPGYGIGTIAMFWLLERVAAF